MPPVIYRSKKMANKNYQTAKFYARLFELREMLNNELIPTAVHIGANQEDAKLFESLEVLATDINEHLENYELTAKEVK